MTRQLLLGLVVMLIATRALARQSDPCCSCIGNGTACTACFYAGIQEARCKGFAAGSSIRYCGCNAGAEGSGCQETDSRTTIMSAAVRCAAQEVQQLGGGLLNPGDRRDGTYNFEQWALVTPEGTILRASRLDFAEKVYASAERFRPKSGTSAALVIEDADHPENSRQIPLPSVAPIDIDADYPAGLSGQEIWFRVEVGKDEVVDQVLLLNVPDDLVAGRFATELHLLNGELGKALHLRYADEGRHRVVVFGLLRANMEGHLVMVSSRVLLPKCCCNGARCV